MTNTQTLQAERMALLIPAYGCLIIVGFSEWR